VTIEGKSRNPRAHALSRLAELIGSTRRPCCIGAPFALNGAALGFVSLVGEIDCPDPHLLDDFWFDSGLRQNAASASESTKIISVLHVLAPKLKL
jgi:hypothetical protein